MIEMQNEIEVLRRFNEKKLPFKAWPIAPIPGLTTAFTKSWILLVKIPPPAEDILFPSLTDRFTIEMKRTVIREDGTYSLTSLPTTRIPNPYEDAENIGSPFAAKCAAFKVDIPRAWQNDDNVKVELDLMATMQTAKSLNDFEGITLHEHAHQEMFIHWDTCSQTFEAELAALRHFVEDKRTGDREVSVRSRDVFRMIQTFENCWILNYDLHTEFPHLKNPNHPYHRLPKLLLDKFNSFNGDHRAAYESLSQIPNGLLFVNGCPGAGKTEWNMVVAALIQAKRRPSPKPKHSHILFVVDLNKTVDDAADRYFNLCKAAGLKNLRIVRMHGWPYEMRNSPRLNGSGGQSGGAVSTSELDFTKKFLTNVSIAKHTKTARNPNKAPTLDEAAWDYYEKHKHDGFPTLKKVLARMDEGDALSTEDWKALRGQITMLYKAVLKQTDFIATTPVAAYGSFAKLYRPDVIFVDEAPHARELTTLIPLAYFNPLAWIMTGDVKQTKPFVKSGNRQDAQRNNLKFNPYAEQLRTSLMARADKLGAIHSKLLVNNRALGNLHLLPSAMFYNSEMISGYEAADRYPASVAYLKRYLQTMVGVEHVDQNRVVVHLKSGQERTEQGSFWNPAQHEWVITNVRALLKDPGFRSIENEEKPGSIMIETPYSTAVRHYIAEVKTWVPEWQDRVEVLTVDKAQGNQSDVVFLDMVRTGKAGFMNETERLNVAMTRARQAEVIIMNEGMNWRPCRGLRIKAEYTSQIWEDAKASGRLFQL